MQTLAIKHEFRMACLSNGVSLSKCVFDIPESNPVEVHSFTEEVANQLHALGITSEVVHCCQHVSVKSVTYKIGMFVIIGFENEEPIFGCISEIIVHNNSVIFISTVQKSEFCLHLSSYLVQPTQTKSVKMQTDIASFYPLTMYKVSDHSYVVFKYFVPDVNE